MRMKKNSGHTITEIMISMVIFIFMIGGLYTALHAGNVSWAVQDVRVSIQGQARRAMGNFTRDLRVAQGLAINTVIDGNDRTIDIAFTRAGENITYDWTNIAGATQYQLIRSDDNGAVITARDISALSLVETATDIKIDLTVTALSDLQQTEAFSLVGNVAVR